MTTGKVKVGRFLRNLLAFVGGGIAIATGAIALWQFASEAKSEVIARVELNRFTLPAPITKALTESSAREMSKFLSEISAKREGPKPLKQDAAPASKEHGELDYLAFDGDVNKVRLPGTKYLDTYVRVSVDNEGTAPAKALSIKLPDGVFYVIVEREDGSRMEVGPRKRIELDSLSPRQQVIVHGWSATPVDSINVDQFTDDVVVSFEKGMGEVKATAVPVIRAHYRKAIWTRVGFPLILGALLGLIGMAIYQFRRPFQGITPETTPEELQAILDEIANEIHRGAPKDGDRRP